MHAKLASASRRPGKGALLPWQHNNMATISIYEEEAHGLVQKLLSTSLERIRQELGDKEAPGGEWPLGRDFTVEKGQNAVERLVEEWSVSESWKHCINFLGLRRELFTYCVQWSEPTRRRPVPTATASVYFYILAQEQSSRVLVFYVLEGQRLVHRWDVSCLGCISALLPFTALPTAPLIQAREDSIPRSMAKKRN